MVTSLPAVSPNSAVAESGRKHDYRVMQNRQLSLEPTNEASQEGRIGANVSLDLCVILLSIVPQNGISPSGE